MGIVPTARLTEFKDGRRMHVAGLALVRRQPGTAEGVLFATIGDETAVANLIAWPDLVERSQRLVLSASMLGVRGREQREGELICVVC